MESKRRGEGAVCKPRPRSCLVGRDSVEPCVQVGPICKRLDGVSPYQGQTIGCHTSCAHYLGSAMFVRSFVRYWLPVIAWILLIFLASGDLMSAEHTSRFIGP